jgi:uncharacterized membrane protein YbhN (UPF0104 family)
MTELPTDSPPVTKGSATRKSWGKLAAHWLPVLVVAAGCVYVARSVDVQALGASLRTVRLWPIGFALLFAALGVCAHSAYWFVLVNTSAAISLRAMTVYSFASYAANTFLPMRGGEALRVWLVQRRHGVPVTLSGAIIALEKVGDVASLLILVSPLPWLIPDLPPSVGKALRILPCIVFGAAILVAFASRQALRWKILSGFHVVRRPGVLAAGFACIFVAWLFDLSAILSCLAAVHVPPSLEKALVVILSVNIAVAIPATPGQVGTHELGSTIALRLVGVPEAQAIPFALLYHATQLLPILVIGLSTARTLSREVEAVPPPEEPRNVA